MANDAPSGPDVFLSYAREDEARARELAAALDQRGFSVFWDREVPPGQTWHSYIGEALANAKCVIVAWSRHSVVSQWVIEEASEGKDRKVLLPVLFEAVLPPFGFRGIQAANLTDWRPGRPSAGFDGLLGAIRRVVGAVPDGPGSEPVRPPRRPNTAGSRRTALAVVIGLFVIAGGGGTTLIWWLTQPGPPNDTAAPSVVEPEPSDPPSKAAEEAAKTEASAAPERLPPAPVTQAPAPEPGPREPALATRPMVASTPADETDVYRDRIDAKGPTAYWRFNDTDATAADEKGAAYGRYMNSPTQQVDAIVQGVGADKAVELSAGAYVEVPHTPALQAAEFTVIGHARVTDLSATRTLVNKGSSRSEGEFAIEVTTDGGLRAYMIDEVGRLDELVTTSESIAVDRAFFFGVSAGAAGLKLYVNGALEAESAITSAVTSNSDALRFGRWGAGPMSVNAMEGTIDEFAWFSRQLSSEEMRDLASPL